VRAKRGGDLTGPNPTHRGKPGSKDHIATDRDGVPVACTVTAANVNDMLRFERLFLVPSRSWPDPQGVCDKSYDAEHHRDLCRWFGAKPHFHKRGQPRIRARSAALAGRAQQCVGAGGPARVRHPSLLQAACIFLVAGRLAREF
jgi:hypothetical protein